MEKIMDIRFPHLGIEIAHLGRSITIGGFSIAYYGMIIALGMILGFLMASWQAKRTGQNQELYLDLAVWDIIFAIIGARIYYVVFSWDYYAKHPGEILNTRGGGLAIYGGVIAGVITTLIFAKIRKQSFLCLVDTACADFWWDRSLVDGAISLTERRLAVIRMAYLRCRSQRCGSTGEYHACGQPTFGDDWRYAVYSSASNIFV